MQQLQERRLWSAVPNDDGTWTISSFNPDTDEFEPVHTVAGRISFNDARQLVHAGKARRDVSGWPCIVLNRGKRLAIK